MLKLFAAIALSLLLLGTSFAQFPDHARQSRMSVLSKAGTPTPRPSVPNRTVRRPQGAQAGYNYYYGRYPYGGGYAAPARSPGHSAQQESGIPGLNTRPNSSRSRRRR